MLELQAVAAIDEVKITGAARFQNDGNLFRRQCAGALHQCARRNLFNGGGYNGFFLRCGLLHAAHRIRLALFRRGIRAARRLCGMSLFFLVSGSRAIARPAVFFLQWKSFRFCPRLIAPANNIP